jgi:hypothetical protein
VLNFLKIFLDLSHSDTRLSVVLNGLEMHQYNRSQLYCRLEQIFGLDSQLMKNAEGKEDQETAMKEKPEARTSRKAPKSPGKLYTWRDLIPVVKVDVFSVIILFAEGKINLYSFFYLGPHCVWKSSGSHNSVSQYRGGPFCLFHKACRFETRSLHAFYQVQG